MTPAGQGSAALPLRGQANGQLREGNRAAYVAPRSDGIGHDRLRAFYRSAIAHLPLSTRRQRRGAHTGSVEAPREQSDCRATA